MSGTTPSALEIQNAKKVLEYLTEMDEVSFEIMREDIFTVSNAESGVSCVVDVEESIVCLSTEVCNLPEDDGDQFELYKLLMDLNGKAIHGKFIESKGKIYFRDNLEFANLDKNELEASLKWTFGMVGANIKQISKVVLTSEEFEELDFEDPMDFIDVEDIVMMTAGIGEVVAGETEEEKEDVKTENKEEYVPSHSVDVSSPSVETVESDSSDFDSDD